MLIPVLLTGQNEPNTKIDLPKKNIYGEAHPGVFTKVVMNYEKQFKLGEKVSILFDRVDELIMGKREGMENNEDCKKNKLTKWIFFTPSFTISA